jgi:hypothetical protein
MDGIIPQGVALLNTAASRLFRLRKTVLNSARIISDGMATPAYRKWRALFVTLTYRPGVDWSPDHVSDYLQRVRVWAARQGVKLRYVWVAELQEGRMAKRPGDNCVHYHVMLWLPRHLMLPKSDKRGWWPHGMTKTEVARKPVGYMAKYASKLQSKDGGRFPSGCRLHGVGGLDQSGRAEVRWWNLPKWARERWPLARAISLRRPVGGGILDLETGEVVRGEFVSAGFFTIGGEAHAMFIRRGDLIELPDWLRQSRRVSAARPPKMTTAFYGDVISRSSDDDYITATARRDAAGEPSASGLSRIDWLLSLPWSIRGQVETGELDWSLVGWSGCRSSVANQ